MKFITALQGKKQKKKMLSSRISNAFPRKKAICSQAENLLQ